MQIKVAAFICCLVAGAPTCARAGPAEYDAEVRAVIRDRVEGEKTGLGMVVGIVDEAGTRTICYGKCAEGSERALDGDTEFEIGSVTKVFTGLLLQQMIDRGEMALDDPAAKFLPPAVKLPERDGKQVTLAELITHTSGLPRDADNYTPRDWLNPAADFTAQQMYAFLSQCKLNSLPGTKCEYSNLGVGLLGHMIALKADRDFETLMVDRICRPLKMNATRITLTPELKKQMAEGHNTFGERVGSLDLGVGAGSGGLRSSANDMLKFVAANLGLPRSELTAALDQTHVIHYADGTATQTLGWQAVTVFGNKILAKNGGTFGFSSFIGLNKQARRGVIVLSNSRDDMGVNGLGYAVLISDEKRCSAVNPPSGRDAKIAADFTGQYQLGPKASVPNLLFSVKPKGDRLLLTPDQGYVSGELLPEAKDRFVGALTQRHVLFTRDGSGKVIKMLLESSRSTETASKVSEKPFGPPQRPRKRKAIPANPGSYAALAGRFKLPSGNIIDVRRDRDQLLARIENEKVTMALLPEAPEAPKAPEAPGAPESNNTFFYPNGTAELTFVKDAHGRVTKLITIHLEGSNVEAKRLAD